MKRFDVFQLSTIGGRWQYQATCRKNNTWLLILRIDLQRVEHWKQLNSSLEVSHNNLQVAWGGQQLVTEFT